MNIHIFLMVECLFVSPFFKRMLSMSITSAEKNKLRIQTPILKSKLLLGRKFALSFASEKTIILKEMGANNRKLTSNEINKLILLVDKEKSHIFFHCPDPS